MKTPFILVFALLLALAGCKKEYELKKSVFISDPDFPELPTYSEWGYNTFGAYYDREVFKSNDYLVPVKIISEDNSISLLLNGQKGDGYYYSSGLHEMTLTFTLAGISATEYSDLVALNDTTIDLTNPLCHVTVSIDTVKYDANILSGQLNIKRAQYLQVDEVPEEVILSGLFELKAILKDQPITISEGRFDVGISADNFYTY